MEPELMTRFTALENKVDEMHATLQKIKSYFFWTGVITLILFVLPLVGLLFAVPSFLSSYNQIDAMTGGF